MATDPTGHSSDFGIGVGSQLYGNLSQTMYNHLFPPNSKLGDCKTFQSFIDSGGEAAIMSARSYHPGIVNVMFADGSVKAMKDTTNVQVWQAIGTAGGAK